MVMSKALIDVLRKFSEFETHDDAVPVLGDDDAARVLASWSKIPHVWHEPKRACPVITTTNHADVWAWVISGWTLDMQAIAAGAGCSMRTTLAKMNMLIANRLIYPDGQMTKGARAALQIYVASKLNVKRRKRPAVTDDGSSTGDDNN